MISAFQSSAFQDNAFQIEVVTTTITGTILRPIPARLPTIHATLKIKERRDSCSSTATLGFDPVEMDNNLLLLAA